MCFLSLEEEKYLDETFSIKLAMSEKFVCHCLSSSVEVSDRKVSVSVSVSVFVSFAA